MHFSLVVIYRIIWSDLFQSNRHKSLRQILKYVAEQKGLGGRFTVNEKSCCTAVTDSHRELSLYRSPAWKLLISLLDVITYNQLPATIPWMNSKALYKWNTLNTNSTVQSMFWRPFFIPNHTKWMSWKVMKITTTVAQFYLFFCAVTKAQP